MPLLGFLFVCIICLFGSLDRKSKSVEKNKRLSDQGAFLKRDYDRHREIFHDYWMDWYCGDGKCVPEEYVIYLDRNPEAAATYIHALTSKQEVLEGLQPYSYIGTYNKNTYNAFDRFNYLYKKKIDTYNKTGKFYP